MLFPSGACLTPHVLLINVLGDGVLQQLPRLRPQYAVLAADDVADRVLGDTCAGGQATQGVVGTRDLLEEMLGLLDGVFAPGAGGGWWWVAGGDPAVMVGAESDLVAAVGVGRVGASVVLASWHVIPPWWMGYWGSSWGWRVFMLDPTFVVRSVRCVVEFQGGHYLHLIE